MIARSIVTAALLLSTPLAVAHANGNKNKVKPTSSNPAPLNAGGGNPGGGNPGGGNPGGGNTPVLSTLSCTDYLGVIFRDFAATKCSGWWEGNEISGNVPAAPVKTALENLGLSNPSYIQKLEFGNYSNDELTKQAFLDFDAPLYGMTVVGIHWGSGVFKSIPNAPKKLGTAFFWFDAGTKGIDKLYMSDTWSQSLSNAALYKTGEPCKTNCGGGPDGNPVPEPSSLALMVAGLTALGAAARRRTKATN